MLDLAFLMAVWALRLVLVVQVCEIHHDVHTIRKQDKRARADFGPLSYVECAVAVGVSIAALVSHVDIAFWPMVIGLPAAACALVFSIRHRLVLVGDRLVRAGTKVFARDDIRCTFRGVSLHIDGKDQSATVPFPIMRWDAMAEKLGVTL